MLDFFQRRLPFCCQLCGLNALRQDHNEVVTLFRGEKLTALSFQKAALYQLFQHSGAGRRCTQPGALYALDLSKLLCTGVLHC